MAHMTVDDKLGCTRFNTDEDHPHIVIDENCADEKLLIRLTQACPAGLYRMEEGKLVFSHEGCLECGTCRVLAGNRALKTWTYPVNGKGVEFTQG